MSNQRLTTGEKIKKTRIQKEFTQKQLAEKCGMYESQIRKYESGKINPKIETLQKIATATHTRLVISFENLEGFRDVNDLY